MTTIKNTRLARVMLKKGITLSQLEEESKIAHSTLSQIKNGVRKNPSKDTLQKIADAESIKMTVESLFPEYLKAAKKAEKEKKAKKKAKRVAKKIKKIRIS